MKNSDLRQYAPATERNREPILKVLKNHLPPTGCVLEIASGTGEHAIFFAPRLAPRRWLPTDVTPVALDSIAAWRDYATDHIQTKLSDTESPNMYPPIQLDVTEPLWPVEIDPLPQSLQKAGFVAGSINAIAAINMIHIAPWSACEGLIAGASRILPPGGILYLYGPYKQADSHTAPSNAAFDQSLRTRNPAWGVRDLDAVTALAVQHQLSQSTVIPMPANNLSVIFIKNESSE